MFISSQGSLGAAIAGVNAAIRRQDLCQRLSCASAQAPSVIVVWPEPAFSVRREFYETGTTLQK